MSSQLATSEESTVSRGSSVAANAGLGVFAAATGYLLTYLLIGAEVRQNLDGEVASWKGVAWYFYEAHMVDIEATRQAASFGGTGILNLIAESNSASADVLYVLPPLVLFAVGAFLAVRWETTDLGDAVMAGAPVTIGYAVVLGLGAVVAEANTEASVWGIETTSSIGPTLLPAIVLGGILYPLVFATVGAATATAINAQ
ncbi:hypothetical protein [Natrinema versiforme]|uniref:DUF7978 domain-containing protein n=1 Tax=Natrinema versiforme TaxID=88724 RepID=A0A4V1FXP0_9EURY|nr:hypothetical protein [Natrinema versiforme]QCS41041.1 hypothetical protein FEJ81_01260 [Natrinema versiforme]